MFLVLKMWFCFCLDVFFLVLLFLTYFVSMCLNMFFIVLFCFVFFSNFVFFVLFFRYSLCVSVCFCFGRVRLICFPCNLCFFSFAVWPFPMVQ